MLKSGACVRGKPGDSETAERGVAEVAARVEHVHERVEAVDHVVVLGLPRDDPASVCGQWLREGV